ncbi:6078_t:CDS:1, partial [Funneliformis caledonium]
KEKIPPQKRQNTTQIAEQEVIAEISNITQPPVITMKVDQISNTTFLPLIKEN